MKSFRKSQSSLLRETAKREPDLEYLKCNLCGRDQPIILLRKFDFYIVKCSHCSLVYANPRLIPSILLTRHNEDYLMKEYLPSLEIWGDQVDMAPFRLKYCGLLDFLEGFKKNLSLLDVGCGPGLFVKAAEERGWAAQGVDISSSAVEFGKKNLGVHLFCGSLEEMHFEEDRFDVILFQDVVEHLFDPLTVLGEVYRVLRRGGVVFISTPNLRSFMGRLLGKEWAVLNPAEHLYYFTRGTLMKMLSQIGYSRTLSLDLSLSFTASNSHHPEEFRARVFGQLAKVLIGRRALRFLWRMGMNDSLNVAAEK